MPEAYERWLAPTVFHPFAVDLARRALSHAPKRVLELAAGTGVLTRELVGGLPQADVTATDLNPAMVDFGRQATSGATWRQADALDLPFQAGEFDLIACQFGVMFFPDKPAGFSQARRVLTAEGTFIFNMWAAIDTHEFEVAVVAALEQMFPNDPPTFLASVPHGYANSELAIADLVRAGLRCVDAQTVTLEGRAESVADLAAGYCTGTPLRDEIEARGDLEATATVVAEEMERRLGRGPVTAKMTAHIIEAKPS